MTHFTRNVVTRLFLITFRSCHVFMNVALESWSDQKKLFDIDKKKNIWSCFSFLEAECTKFNIAMACIIVEGVATTLPACVARLRRRRRSFIRRLRLRLPIGRSARAERSRVLSSLVPPPCPTYAVRLESHSSSPAGNTTQLTAVTDSRRGA